MDTFRDTNKLTNSDQNAENSQQNENMEPFMRESREDNYEEVHDTINDEINMNFNQQSQHQQHKFKNITSKQRNHELKSQQDQSEIIEALTSCIYSSISKSKMQEIKIKELENVISHLSYQNNQSVYVSVPTNNQSNLIIPQIFSKNTSPSKQNFVNIEDINSHQHSQQLQQQYNAIKRKSPCQRHAQSKSPDSKKGQQIQKKGGLSRPHSTDELTNKEQENKKKQFRLFPRNTTEPLLQFGVSNYNNNGNLIANSNNKNNNEFVTLSPQTKIMFSPSLSQAQMILNQSQESSLFNSSSNLIHNDYLYKLRFLEEAIDYKNKEIEKLMVLTAVSKKNEVSNNSPPKQSQPSNGHTTASFASSFGVDHGETGIDETIREREMKQAILNLQQKTTSQENQLMKYKFQMEEKDRDLQLIQEQIEQLQSCAENQLEFIHLSEELENRLKEKEQSEQDLLARLEQQSLLIQGMEEEMKMKAIEFEQTLDIFQQEKEEMKEELRKVQSIVASKAEEERRSRRRSEDCSEIQIQSLQEKIEIQNQLLDKQKQANDILRREVQQLQAKNQEVERARQETDRDRKNLFMEQTVSKDEAIRCRQLLSDKEKEISQAVWQYNQLKKSFDELQLKDQQKIQDYEEIISQIQEENQRLKDDKSDSTEILELKKQLMFEGIAKQELSKKSMEVSKLRQHCQELVKENQDLRSTLEQLKSRVRDMQNIDEDIKAYINDMCSEKNNLQDRHVAHLEEIKNLRLNIKSLQIENKSLEMSVSNLKEEVLIYKNQQSDIQSDEKTKKVFFKQLLQKKLNLLNSQLETYIRTTLDLDEIYNILLFSRVPSAFSSPKKQPAFSYPSHLSASHQVSAPTTGSEKKQNTTPLRTSMEPHQLGSGNKLNLVSNMSTHFQAESVEGSGLYDEKMVIKVDQLNQKRKRDLDKVYAIMEDFVSLISNTQ